MTRAQFAVACGAPAAWIEAAADTLGRPLAYSVDDARYLSLAKRIQEDLDLSLESAGIMAAKALRPDASESAAGPDILSDTVASALPCYLSDFAVRLAQAVTHFEPRSHQSFPPRQPGAIRRARAYGLDIGLIENALSTTPAERLRRLDQNLAFVQKLRAVR